MRRISCLLLNALMLLLAGGGRGAASAGPAAPATDDDALWREKIGYNPQVHAAVANSSDAELFARVPYAYYPSANELEVAFDAVAATKLLPPGSPAPAGPWASVRVRVYPAVIAPELLAKYPFFYAPAPAVAADPQQELATCTIPLDAKGRGYGTLKLPPLAPGNYRVEYEFAGARLAAAKTFRRTRFEWEGCTYGLEHKVYAPFEPVRVEGRTVSVVDRTYTVNALGLFDSVVAKGHELLAAPMTLVAETADGQRVRWEPAAGGGVSGKAVFPDLARFETGARAEGTGFRVETSVDIEEDGCARVRMRLNPDVGVFICPTVRRMWLEIALKESEAPLCHLVGMNSMRHNYAGAVPRGGTITWLNQAWRPARFEVEPFPAGQVPASYEVWDATKNMHWGNERWSFAPYVWLGSEERGLAWFGDHTGGYETDGRRGIQRLAIEPGRVVLRVELIQQPVTLTAPRTFEFGLQASPTKPMPKDWRGASVPGGGGMSVVVWGGFNCSDKVPANKDWTIVDKIMEGARTGKADYAWFADYAKTHTTLINEGGGARPGVLRRIPLEQAQANGQPWLTALGHFVGRAAGLRPDEGITVYFEEHQTNGNYPEVAEFMDEWSDGTFARYRFSDYPLTWGPEIRSANAASYRDFAVFYANEWMRRGVGIYYDNTFPITDVNRGRLRDRGLAWSSSIWGHREYYKRVWKRSRELMVTGAAPRPLFTVGHVTNCQVLPYTTWWDATLGVEAPGQWQPAEPLSAAARQASLDQWGFVILPGPQKGQAGTALPYPPDYLRAMEMGRTAGLIPHYRHALRSEDAFGGLGIGFGATSQGQAPAERAHRYLSDAGMGLVHEIRGGASGYDQPVVGDLRRAITEFGYGRPDVKVCNYWDEKPFVTVDNPDVKWLAMQRAGPVSGLLLLQSYRPEAMSTTVRFPDSTLFIDAETREPLAAGADGAATVALAGDCGTRLLYALRSAAEPRLLPNMSDSVLVDDFELGLGARLVVRGAGAAVVPDTGDPGNHVLRILPGHPSQNVLRPQGFAFPADSAVSFWFRVSELPTKAGTCGLLSVGYRESAGRRFYFGLGLKRAADGAMQWTVGTPVLVLDGGKNEGYQKPIASAACTAPVSREWHILTVRTQGPRHQIFVDAQLVFEGEDTRNLAGGFSLAPGWGWDLPIACVEVDNLEVKTLADGTQRE